MDLKKRYQELNIEDITKWLTEKITLNRGQGIPVAKNPASGEYSR